MSEEEQIILPERFKRVEYLESSGTQYIDTKVLPERDIEFELRVKYFNPLQPTTGECVFGMRDTTVTPQWRYMVSNYTTSSGTFATGGGYASFGNNRVAKSTVDNHQDYIFKYKDDIYSNGVDTEIEIDISNDTHAEPLPSNYNLLLFAGNYVNQSYKDNFTGRVYYLKIWKSGSLIRYFIPSYDIYTTRGCMYEVVEGKAYYNEGGGDFIYNLKDTHLGILHDLPDGFKKVGYLIANGEQWIDTDYIPTNETGYYLEGQGYVNESTTRYYFGSNETSDWNLNQRIYFAATPFNYLGWMTSITVTNAAANLRQETKVALNFLNSRKCVTTINETDFTNELSDLSFTPTQKIILFNVNLGGSPHTGGLKGRIDTFLISEGNQIVRQFIPCLDADGIPCMYELYTGTVHYNQGSGQFSYPRNYNISRYEVPAGYTKCLYLQSNGTQRIDTGHIPDADTGVYLKAQHLSYGDHPPIGSWESANNYYYPPRFNLTNKAGVYSFGTTYQVSFYYDKGDDLIYTSTMNLYNDRTLNFWSEDTNWFGIIPVNFTATFTRPLWLFSYNMDNTSINATYGKFGGRIYRAQITQGDTLVHDYVPCLDTNNRPCMYDVIEQKTLYNQGTGADFEYCVEHELPSDFIKLKYLEGSGTQYIKTGYVPTNNTGLYIDAYNTVVKTNWTLPFALRETNGNTYIAVGRVNKTTNQAAFGWGAWTTVNGAGDCRYEATLNWLNDKKSIITAPAFAQRVNNLSNLSFTPTFDLCLFGIHYYDGTYNGSCYRIYRAKISEGSEIVRDWVPAYDDRRSKPCMYDLINNVAYYNDGTGDFLYNRDFEGTYTGFSGLGCIGNRLGGSSEDEV
jgi:hypothetical protein